MDAKWCDAISSAKPFEKSSEKRLEKMLEKKPVSVAKLFCNVENRSEKRPTWQRREKRGEGEELEWVWLHAGA